MKSRTKSRKEAAGKRAHEQTKPLCKLVQGALDSYFRDLNGHNPGDGLYRMVIEEVERPLLEKVLQHTDGNISRSAQILGVTRATLRKKLALHKL